MLFLNVQCSDRMIGFPPSPHNDECMYLSSMSGKAASYFTSQYNLFGVVVPRLRRIVDEQSIHFASFFQPLE